VGTRMFVILVTANRDFAHITQFEESARVGGALCATGLGSRRDSASLTLSSAPVGPRVLKPKLPSFANPAPDVLYLH
jgi:hypothetical protein